VVIAARRARPCFAEGRRDSTLDEPRDRARRRTTTADRGLGDLAGTASGVDVEADTGRSGADSVTRNAADSRDAANARDAADSRDA
jgi:hypothetical protein